MTPALITKANDRRVEIALKWADFQFAGRELSECHHVLEGVADSMSRISPEHRRMFGDWKSGHGRTVTIADVMCAGGSSADLLTVIMSRLTELKGEA